MYKIDKLILLQIVVIIVIWVISLLVIYMLFLICLDPLLNKRIHKASANIGYHEHNNEEVNIKFLDQILITFFATKIFTVFYYLAFLLQKK